MRASSINAIKRNRTARLAKLITRAYYLRRRGREDRMYTIVCNEFMSLGGVYIKFLQGVMLKSQIMRRWHNPERLKIFENLETEPLDVVGILRKELPPEKLAQITMVQPQPFAAGSFGQVYYGQHVSGKPIIIKVLRPMVRELLRYDLRLLSAFTRSFFVKLYKNMDVNINGAIKEFREATLHETDYNAEAEFAAELYETYKDHPHLVIPETFTELCTSHIIVQEYVDGISVAYLVKLQEQGVNPYQYVKDQLGSDLDEQLYTLGFEALNGIFNLHRIPGDPHPGNIKLMPDNKVGLIDFGIAARTPHDKSAFFGLLEEWNRMYTNSDNITALFEQFIRFFVSDLYRSLKRLSALAHKPEAQANFTTEVGKVAQESFVKIVGESDVRAILADGRIFQLLNQMINKDNRFGLVMRLEASEILRAAQTYLTLVDSLGRRSTVLPRVFGDVVAQVRHDHPHLMHEQEDSISISDALETVSNWLERVADRDPALFRQLTSRINLKAKTIPVVEESTNV